MTALAAFDLNASFPPDPKHREAVEAMVCQAAEYAGCSAAVAKDLAAEVGDAFSAGLSRMPADMDVTVRFARGAQAVDVAVTCGDTVRISRPAPVAQ